MPEDTPPSAAEADDTLRLSDHPGWLYLLREFQEIYSRGSPGGSKAIRAHRRKVRDCLSLVLGANPAVTPRQPVLKPVVAHLPRAFDLAQLDSHPPDLDLVVRSAEKFDLAVRAAAGDGALPAALAYRHGERAAWGAILLATAAGVPLDPEAAAEIARLDPAWAKRWGSCAVGCWTNSAPVSSMTPNACSR